MPSVPFLGSFFPPCVWRPLSLGPRWKEGNSPSSSSVCRMGWQDQVKKLALTYALTFGSLVANDGSVDLFFKKAELQGQVVIIEVRTSCFKWVIILAKQRHKVRSVKILNCEFWSLFFFFFNTWAHLMLNYFFSSEWICPVLEAGGAIQFVDPVTVM